MVMADDWERAEMLKDNIIPHAIRSLSSLALCVCHWPTVDGILGRHVLRKRTKRAPSTPLNRMMVSQLMRG